MTKGKTCQFTIGDWDITLDVVYVPHYDRFDDWRDCVWNPIVLVDVDIISILATYEHYNFGYTSSRWIEFDDLKGIKQEKIMENIREMDDK